MNRDYFEVRDDDGSWPFFVDYDSGHHEDLGILCMVVFEEDFSSRKNECIDPMVPLNQWFLVTFIYRKETSEDVWYVNSKTDQKRPEALNAAQYKS